MNKIDFILNGVPQYLIEADGGAQWHDQYADCNGVIFVDLPEHLGELLEISIDGDVASLDVEGNETLKTECVSCGAVADGFEPDRMIFTTDAARKFIEKHLEEIVKFANVPQD